MKGEKVDSFMGSNKEKLAEFCYKMSKITPSQSNKGSRPDVADQATDRPSTGSSDLNNSDKQT